MTPHYPRTVVLAALAIAACSQTEPPQASKPKPAATATAPQAPAAQPSQDIDPALKERLARQEAAAQMFEKKVLEPPAPRVAAPPPAPAAPPPKVEAKPEPRPEPVKAAARTEPA